MGADLVVLWGVNAAYSTINVMTLVKQARARGAVVVVVDPYRTPTAQQADLHLMVRPGTDAALALAVMHVLIAEGYLDRDYIQRATLGFERLAEHVKAYSPETVAPIVGLDVATIVGFARRYGAGPGTFIRIGIGISRHDNGGMTCRTLACLPALTGAYADPHGGALLSSTAGFGFDYAVLERPDLMPAPPPRTALPHAPAATPRATRICVGTSPSSATAKPTGPTIALHKRKGPSLGRLAGEGVLRSATRSRPRGATDPRNRYSIIGS